MRFEMLKNRGKALHYQGVDATSLRLRREVREHRIRGLRSHNLHQLLTRRPTHARETAEGGQQKPAPTWSDAGNEIQFRSHIPFLPRQPMEGHRKSMRFVPNPLDEQERRTLGR